MLPLIRLIIQSHDYFGPSVEPCARSTLIGLQYQSSALALVWVPFHLALKAHDCHADFERTSQMLWLWCGFLFTWLSRRMIVTLIFERTSQMLWLWCGFLFIWLSRRMIVKLISGRTSQVLWLWVGSLSVGALGT